MGGITSKSHLSQEEIEYLSKHTRYDEQAVRQWYKGFKQDYPKGRITTDEFIEMYKNMFQNGNAEQFCCYVFKSFDTENQGYIDFKRFLLCIDVAVTGSARKFTKKRILLVEIH